MKILVVITGGTIGSSVVGDYTSLDIAKNYALINHYESKFKDGVTFETVSPYRILSENLTANELNLLKDCIAQHKDKDYDGIIVTHGTDTLQYSSAALSYCFPVLELPVVLVSANFPLDNPMSNGHQNFEAAVAFIKAKLSNGVFASYKNRHSDKTDIHLGTRMYTHLENRDEVYSIGMEPYAYYKDGKTELNEKFTKTTSAQENHTYSFENKTGVLIISSLPGDNFAYDLSGVKSVLIRPYHSGTINTSDGCLKAFCERATNSDIPVFILSADIHAGYESTSAFEQMGIIPLPLSTFVSQYMKLWMANSNNLDVRGFMQTEIAQEFIR